MQFRRIGIGLCIVAALLTTLLTFLNLVQAEVMSGGVFVFLFFYLLVTSKLPREVRTSWHLHVMALVFGLGLALGIVYSMLTSMPK